jgi:uncharacterized protein (TIGR02145 family)
MSFFKKIFGNDQKDSGQDSENVVDLPCVTIGSQVWTTENLDVSSFKNGDVIHHATTEEDWINCTKKNIPAWCYPIDKLGDESETTAYGKLYNWYAVNDKRVLAPAGWRIPTKTDWESLATHIGEEGLARSWSADTIYGDAGTEIKGKKQLMFCGIGTPDEDGFKLRSTEWRGNNSTGFNAQNSVWRDDGGMYGFPGVSAWWSTTKQGKGESWHFILSSGANGIILNYELHGSGMFIRCLRN